MSTDDNKPVPYRGDNLLRYLHKGIIRTVCDKKQLILARVNRSDNCAEREWTIPRRKRDW